MKCISKESLVVYSFEDTTHTIIFYTFRVNFRSGHQPDFDFLSFCCSSFYVSRGPRLYWRDYGLLHLLFIWKCLISLSASIIDTWMEHTTKLNDFWFETDVNGMEMKTIGFYWLSCVEIASEEGPFVYSNRKWAFIWIYVESKWNYVWRLVGTETTGSKWMN